jgi:hypothetical protein
MNRRGIQREISAWYSDGWRKRACKGSGQRRTRRREEGVRESWSAGCVAAWSATAERLLVDTVLYAERVVGAIGVFP